MFMFDFLIIFKKNEQSKIRGLKLIFIHEFNIIIIKKIEYQPYFIRLIFFISHQYVSIFSAF